ncbi:WD domain, G-beta repeat protein [Cordyceps fumosorosea ARSEF 2679]|uniref:WD domain, G-beta repeat protein n=1 Tax=Cordyceps fumosorosea (strain ARSEF 2679) TaxID=1081104 RepID=A0A167M3F0_CORFA|nr:WD domain, G-beta repeat protein [Cordyceps fumosorosea ARSEF 2679]OAA53869.1 WD domain, G-beta repeat protein [Cordyceps fumosorosea ARSEF 2679]
MSAPASSQGHAISRASERSSTARGRNAHDSAMPSLQDLKYFDPCGATASMFLYVQGSSVVCCHHDSLTIERRFTGHQHEVLLLAIDNHSQYGGGRIAASYDSSRRMIIWDLMTGEMLKNFTAVADCQITAITWMRNGNLAFGDSHGSVTVFEIATSEHMRSKTLEQTAITALAPSQDCLTFAIGFQTGTLLIARIQPRFTIMHNLTTSRAPSPVIGLSWHASSSRQKSEMLAVQKHDGDLRVWSVTKAYSIEEPAKVVRILRKAEAIDKGSNWMGWSKNGRVIQFSDSETLSWDVRTKHVTFDSIPTLEHVRGMALYGPGASLFTVGPNGTVQQFDLNSPAIMVANVQHPTSHLPPSPPNSIEEIANQSVHSATTIHTSESESSMSSIPLEMNVSESDEDHLSPFARIARGQAHPDSGNETYESASPVSSRSGLSSSQSRSSLASPGSRTPGRHPTSSVRSQNTYISTGTSLKSSTIGRQPDIDSYSMGYSLGSTSVTSSRSRQRPSRLRHEVPRSPDENKVHDLFKFTRSRLSDIPYKHPMSADNSRLTNDDLRRQMLSTIFGWHSDVDDLIRDEMQRHPSGSSSRILLSKWLGEMDTDIMADSARDMTSSDWMLFALSGIGSAAGQQKIGQVYVRRLLESGEIHVAVTIMLGMGERNDAIEVYISHKRYMEALLLTCLTFPGVWERQAAIIRKWGEWAVQHHQQQLAIRCFACTDQESSEPWRSPSAVQLNFQSITPSIPEVLSPPLSPPGIQRGPQRSVAKSSALKLITSFGDPNHKAKFYANMDDGQTPIAAGVTPIADSAISPGGSYEAATAFLRPSSNSRFNTPTSARPAGSLTSRGRLPSIGEAPSDINRDSLARETKKPGHSGHSRMASADYDNFTAGTSLARASTASPMMMRDQFSRLVDRPVGERPPSPDSNVMARMQESKSNVRNGSRNRIPNGKLMELHSLGSQPMNDPISPQQSGTSSARFHWPTRRRGPGSVASSITSNSSAGRSYRHGRQRDDYIHSLEAAKNYPGRSRSGGHSKERPRESSRNRQGSVERRDRSREQSEDRGRAPVRSWVKPKRSPTSPIPMSPEDLANLTAQKFIDAGESTTSRRSAKTRAKGSSRTSSRGSKGRSPDRKRQPSALEARGRSQGRESFKALSPASPIPLSATALHLQGSEDEEDLKRAIEEQEAFRAKHGRSVSQGVNSPTTARREASESRRKNFIIPDVLEDNPPVNQRSRAASTDHVGDLRQFKDERLKRKEQAARELEERRKSLAKRAHTPGIVHPDEYAALPNPERVAVETSEPKPLAEGLPPRSATDPPKNMYARGTSPMIGLPATPKAMRLILANGMSNSNVPPVPSLPTKEAKEVKPAAQDQAPSLTLLPSTVYQPPVRPMIPRSMSAPIPEDLPQSRRKMSFGGIANIDAVVQSGERRRSNEEPVPPPPPPAPVMLPPMLKELQHLAKPPPPPPAPLPHTKPTYGAGGAVGSGMIEIVMDDDEQPQVAAPNDHMVPVLSPPVPPPSRGHNRGRSVGGEGSISGRSARGSERRSRSRKNTYPPPSAAMEMMSGCSSSHHQSKPILAPPPVLYDRDVIRSPIDKKGKHMSTGLDRSEMI